MPILDSYAAPSGCTIEMGIDAKGVRWVRCWDEEGSLHWELRGKVLTDDGTRQTTEPYSEETQLAEFNRWRT